MHLYSVEQVPGDWGALDATPADDEELRERVEKLLVQLSLREKIDQMSGDSPLLRGSIELMWGYNARPLPAGENLRLGIPGIRFSDGPRGVVMYRSTCFPVAIARGAAWDPDLEERIGDAIGVEVRSQGANFFGGVCVNLLRHPAWGRAQETYGEDPHHLGEMGAALVRGVQRHAMACVKHFAANSIEEARFKVDVRVDERTLREVYLRHFERCIREGAASVMSAYNKLNGAFCGHNRRLLTDILRGDWGFDGFVVSDFSFGVRSARAAAAGCDVEMPHTLHYGRRLERKVESGEVPAEAIDTAVRRILFQKLRFASVGEPERYRKDSVASETHRALAREAAAKSIVLLQNRAVEPGGAALLPIDPSALRRLAVIGRLARAANLGDLGSSAVRPPSVSPPLDGLREAAGGAFDVIYDSGRRPERAEEAAREADVAVVVVGYDHRDEGEYVFFRGGDRRSLTLASRDEQLIQRIAAANPRTVVVMIGGSAIVTEAWRDAVPALLMAWYPGMEGGRAIADILLGVVNPSGRLPCVFPRSAEQLPHFDPRAKQIDYGYFHGQWLLDRNGDTPAFPFGFGLSYTRFGYARLSLASDTIAADGELIATLDVTNEGERAGDEVVQLYVGFEDSRLERPERVLAAFARVHLEAGETRSVRLAVPARQLAAWDTERNDWWVEPCAGSAWVGPSASRDTLLRAAFRIHQ